MTAVRTRKGDLLTQDDVIIMAGYARVIVYKEILQGGEMDEVQDIPLSEVLSIGEMHYSVPR